MFYSLLGIKYYSYIINSALIECQYSSKLQHILNDCNGLDGVNGLIYKNYSENNECQRMFFTSSNAQKCDAIRIYIQKLLNENDINIDEFHFLLFSFFVGFWCKSIHQTQK